MLDYREFDVDMVSAFKKVCALVHGAALASHWLAVAEKSQPICVSLHLLSLTIKLGCVRADTLEGRDASAGSAAAALAVDGAALSAAALRRSVASTLASAFLSHAVADENLLIPVVDRLREQYGAKLFLCGDSIPTGR